MFLRSISRVPTPSWVRPTRPFEYLDEAFVDRSPGLVFLNVDRAWDDVRDDPRFEDAVRRMALPSGE